MLGAFAGRDFKPFEFLGFYTGDLLEFEDGKSPGVTTNQYGDEITSSSPSQVRDPDEGSQGA